MSVNQYLVISVGNDTEYVGLLSARRETSTHGCIYALYKTDAHDRIFIAQSVPVLVHAINQKFITNRQETLFCSSLYRMLRLLCRRREHKGYRIERFELDSLSALNDLIKTFRNAVFVCKTPTFWKASLFPRGEMNDSQNDCHDNPDNNKDVESTSIENNNISDDNMDKRT